MIYFIGILICIALLFLILFLGPKGKIFYSGKSAARSSVNLRIDNKTKEIIQRQLAEAETLKKTAKPAQLKQAILELDKGLNLALESLYPGKNFVEKMKQVKPKIKNGELYDNLWYAHKVRNIIAHEINTDLAFTELQRVMDIFEESLRDLINS